MPVSVTEKRSVTLSPVSSPGRTRMTTFPLSVNLIALPVKLMRTWRNLTGSPRTAEGTSGPISAPNSRPFSTALRASISTTSSAAFRMSKPMKSRASMSASILEKSRMSLMTDRRDPAQVCMVSAYLR